MYLFGSRFNQYGSSPGCTACTPRNRFANALPKPRRASAVDRLRAGNTPRQADVIDRSRRQTLVQQGAAAIELVLDRPHLLLVSLDFAGPVSPHQLRQLRPPVGLREKRCPAGTRDVRDAAGVQVDRHVDPQAVGHARSGGVQRRAEILGVHESARRRRQLRPVQQRRGGVRRRHESDDRSGTEDPRMRLRMALDVHDAGPMQRAQLRPGDEGFVVLGRGSAPRRRSIARSARRLTNAIAVMHASRDRIRNRGEAVPFEQGSRHRPQARPGIVEAQRDVRAIQLRGALHVREDVL